MHFDLNQEVFENKTKKAIWLFGRDLVPLEVSLANISDERDKEGYTQVYRYTHNLFSDMYENPNEYRLYPPENVMFYGVAYYGNLLIDIVKSSELMEDGTLMMAASVYHKMLKKGVRKKDKSKFNRMSCLSRLGIDVREGMARDINSIAILMYFPAIFGFSPRDIDIPYKIFWMFFRSETGYTRGQCTNMP